MWDLRARRASRGSTLTLRPKGGGGDWEVASRQRLQPRERGRAPQMPPPSWSPQLRSLLKGFISRCAHPFHNPTSWSPAP